jgi:hypothetical protein
MIFTDDEISNGGIEHYKYNIESFDFTITHFSHSVVNEFDEDESITTDYIQIKAYDSQWTDMYSTIVEIKYLTEYKSIESILLAFFKSYWLRLYNNIIIISVLNKIKNKNTFCTINLT